ncbi:hypothetical protein DXG01_002781 [Tephrocybe rancida]|nr:hypothetical protein DXG01_002781 [Tephrocybe rancida]
MLCGRRVGAGRRRGGCRRGMCRRSIMGGTMGMGGEMGGRNMWVGSSTDGEQKLGRLDTRMDTLQATDMDMDTDITDIRRTTTRTSNNNNTPSRRSHRCTLPSAQPYLGITLAERASTRLVARESGTGSNSGYYPPPPNQQPQTLQEAYYSTTHHPHHQHTASHHQLSSSTHHHNTQNNLHDDDHDHDQPDPQQQQQLQLPRVVQPSKRAAPSPSPEDEDSPAPRSKRPKSSSAKTPSTSSNSKRGYPARKRSEAAALAASARQAPQLSYTTTAPTSGKGKSRATSSGPLPLTPSTHQNTNPSQTQQTLHAEPQSTRCMSTKYKHDAFPRCVACTRRWAGDTCRFQGIRYFLREGVGQAQPQGSNGNGNGQGRIVGVTFSESREDMGERGMKFPRCWNEEMGWSVLKRTKLTIARALLPTLRLEQAHLQQPAVIVRPRERDVRATCDTCMTSIFSTSWLCRLCGREACADCYSTVCDLTLELATSAPAASASVVQGLEVQGQGQGQGGLGQGQEGPQEKAEREQEQRERREKHAHANPFFLMCTKRVEHKAGDFSPMTRFGARELGRAIKEMERLLAAEPGASTSSAPDPLPSSSSLPQSSYGWHNGLHHPAPPPPLQSAYPPPLPGAPFVPHGLSERTTSVPSHVMPRYAPPSLTPVTFPLLWAQGMPLVVEGLLDRFEVPWTPEYFVERYGGQGCLVIECQSEVNRRVSVGEFFRAFGRYSERSTVGTAALTPAAPALTAARGKVAGAGTEPLGPGVWKLKDWPPSTDFRKAFPELWDDFARAVPVPSYVRRDGVMNLASHFPEGAVGPDIGPKMYNAMATTLSAGSKGSTRLHMDMADAVNIMTYASPAPNGGPGCAAWDLFRAEDSDKLRAYLASRNTQGVSGGAAQKDWTANDPIHGQQFYLDEEMRVELWEIWGVMSYRFYQRPGEAVFIPAGCAHQVCCFLSLLSLEWMADARGR